MSEFHITAMLKLCRKAGADRVSAKATKQLAVELERIGLLIVKEAINFKIHSRRKTLMEGDIEGAAKRVCKGC